MPDHVIAETDNAPAAPDAVVFVVSAVAPMATSDCEMVHRLCGYADLVIGAVSKVDAHRTWREVLAADRLLLAERADRYRDVPWVGVAAAPELGAPKVDELVVVLLEGLADPELVHRNQLRINDIRTRQLRGRRTEIVRGRRSVPSVRAGVHAARVKLTFLVRTRCTQTLVDLRGLASELRRDGADRFEAHVRAAADAFVEEVDAEVTRELDAVAARFGLTVPRGAGVPRAPEIGDPRRRTDRLQFRVTAVLGAGFGVGVALAGSRLIAAAVHVSELAGLIAGGLLGVLAAAWVVGARGLLQFRAAADRWVGEVVVALRACGEEVVASRALSAEMAFANQLATGDEALAARLAAIDAELRRLERRTPPGANTQRF